MRLILLSCVLLFPFLSACKALGGSMVNQEKVDAAHEALNLCINTFSSITDRNIDGGIDRAYVLKSPEKMDILFTHGEVGTFGDRDTDYRAFISCGVLASGNMEIYFLGGPNRDTLIENAGVSQITESLNNEEIWDLLFMREGDDFLFVESKSFYDE